MPPDAYITRIIGPKRASCEALLADAIPTASLLEAMAFRRRIAILFNRARLSFTPDMGPIGDRGTCRRVTLTTNLTSGHGFA